MFRPAFALCAIVWLASASPTAGVAAAATTLAAPKSVANEPLFTDIARRAGLLKIETEGWSKSGLDGEIAKLSGFDAFKADIAALAELDMKGHVVLAARGADGDLKCILKGISQDLAVKLLALEAASTPKARVQAMNDLTYLLRDNVEVITTPATTTS
ncbi:MAG TPA: hypothetical protein VII63_12335 [Caulobacteraceae bacterium]